MWRRPLAYGHATATRIFRRELVQIMGVNDMESFSETPPKTVPRADKGHEGDKRAGDKPDQPARVTTCSRLRPARCFRWRALDSVSITALG